MIPKLKPTHYLHLRTPTRLLPSLKVPTPLRPYSSGSANPSTHPDDWFNRTGEREASDPTQIHMRSDEYSKSGGDDIVAEQRSSFTSIYTDPIMEREVAGRGYVINPLDVSPASPEWSMIVEEQIVEKNADRRPGDRTGYGVTRKTKMVEKNDLDFRMKERRRGMAKA